MDEKIRKAVEILDKGGIVIFPTDTAFAIGCRIDNEKAIKRIFEIRRRPIDKAVPVLVDSIKMANHYLEKVSDEIIELMKKYWPGGLTIICECKKDLVPKLVRGGGYTLGLRMPNNKICLELISKCKIPILGPSANFHGDKTPYKFENLNPELVKLVDYVVSGETNNLGISTVIDCSTNPWKILRQGVVKIENLKLEV